MNQDPNNPIAPNPVAPQMPANPAAAAAPTLDAAPTSSAIPEAPTIDASLLQEAIADVPEEAAATTPDVPSAVSLDNLGAASEPPVANAAADASPFANAAPSANFGAPEAAAPSIDPATGAPIDETTKNTPSVAFNDPAQQPDPAKHGKDINFSEIFEKIKKRPVLAIVGGGAFIIITLVLILAFAV